jgi:hypothetical protein
MHHAVQGWQYQQRKQRRRRNAGDQWLLTDATPQHLFHYLGHRHTGCARRYHAKRAQSVRSWPLVRQATPAVPTNKKWKYN